MGDKPLHVPDKVTCEKCKYIYKSAVTVFAAKDVIYESKCPQCSHHNKKKLKKETILSLTNAGKEDVRPPSSKSDKRIPDMFKEADRKGLYLAVGAVCGYLLGWILKWLSEDGNSFVNNASSFFEKLAIPVFGLGIVLLLFAIATRKFPE